MNQKTFALVVVALSVPCFVAPASAQKPLGARRDGNVIEDALDDLDHLGKSLFGGLLSQKSKKKTTSDSPSSRSASSSSVFETGKFDASRNRTGSASRRAGSIVRSGTQNPTQRKATLPASTQQRTVGTRSHGDTSISSVTEGRRTSSDDLSKAVRVSPERESRVRIPSIPPRRTTPQDILQRRTSGATPDEQITQQITRPTASTGNQSAMSRPLHQRLMTFRQSAFEAGQKDQATPGAKANTSAQAATKPAAKRSPSGSGRPAQTATLRSTAVKSPGLQQKVTGARRQPTRTPTRPDRSTLSTSTDDVLFVGRSPVLGVRTLGPRQITVGRESAYEVFVQNAGEVAADGVVVSVNLPDWADVQGAEASAGSTRPATSPEASTALEWNVGRIQPRDQEKLVLRIVPRKRQPIDLAVRVSHTPLASQAVIEVREPKLDMRLHGPRDVLFGKTEVFKLELANTGNGDAENVVISLAPIDSSGGSPDTHQLGTVAAGKKKIIELELTARQDGQLVVKVDITADGGVRAALDEKILVRRPDLRLSMKGPRMKYVGSAATYRIHAENPGTAPAANVKLTATLPKGAKYLNCDKSGQVDKEKRTVSWALAALPAGTQQVFTLQCQLTEAGFQQLEAAVSGKGDLTASADVRTQVEAIADLTLDVTDPVGPVSVGEDALYELKIQNRGTKGAEGIEVVAYFSHGIEPIAVEGAPHKVEAGQVVFSPLSSLAAGESLVLKIKARAQTAGNHMFRTEVLCKPLGTRLVGEETTHFYDGTKDTAQVAGPAGQSSPRYAPAQPSLRTATRPQPTVAPPRRGTPTLAPLRQ